MATYVLFVCDTDDKDAHHYTFSKEEEVVEFFKDMEFDSEGVTHDVLNGYNHVVGDRLYYMVEV